MILLTGTVLFDRLSNIVFETFTNSVKTCSFVGLFYGSIIDINYTRHAKSLQSSNFSGNL